MNACPQAPTTPIVFGCHTDVGRRREHNEDSYRCDVLGTGVLLVVSDGVGGAKAGEVASRMAADGMHLLVEERLAGETPPLQRERWLDASARELDRRVRDAAQQPGLGGMGATLSALWIDGGIAWWVQAGDSRIYLLRGGELRQISHDQSPVGRLRAQGQLSEEEARNHPYRHMIDQCLGGVGAALEPESGELPVRDGDVFLLCSDGLSDGLWDRDIAAELGNAAKGNEPDAVARTLVIKANQASGNDNITAVVVRIGSNPPGAAPDAGLQATIRSLLKRLFGKETATVSRWLGQVLQQLEISPRSAT